jgi:AraC family transcriptional regulator
VPYRRLTLLRTPVLDWQEARLLAARPDWSDEYRVDGPRLLLPQAGQLDCRLDGRRFSCDAASALWLTPRQGYRLRQPRAGQLSVVIALPGLRAPAGRRELAPTDTLGLVQLRRRWLARRTDALEVEEQVLAWAGRLLGDEGSGAVIHPAVERAREYLAQHFAEAGQLQDVARAAACSPYHLARNFKRATGVGLHAFRNRLRMAEALRRIDAGQADLSALAHELGFSSHSHFGAVFRKTFGMAPAQVRTNLVAATARR